MGKTSYEILKREKICVWSYTESQCKSYCGLSPQLGQSCRWQHTLCMQPNVQLGNQISGQKYENAESGCISLSMDKSNALRVLVIT